MKEAGSGPGSRREVKTARDAPAVRRNVGPPKIPSEAKPERKAGVARILLPEAAPAVAHRPISDDLPLQEVALRIVRGTPKGRELTVRLAEFGTRDELAREMLAPGIRMELAHIVARAVTHTHHREEFLNALNDFRNDDTIANAEPADVERRYPLVARIPGVVSDVLVEVAGHMLLEALFPGAHVLLPPTNFAGAVFDAIVLLEATKGP